MTIQSYTLDRETGVCSVEIAAHVVEYPLAELEGWICFYDRQRERFPKSRDKYDVVINLLESALAERDLN
ncbi:MAG: hypothetical protein GYB53_24690 [Rhodobacteraceae bacterium]|nr:hypothetical protein [Paracoccaceae bacterium]